MTNAKPYLSPPSPRLLRLLPIMAQERGVSFDPPATQTQARAEYRRLKAIPRESRAQRSEDHVAVADVMRRSGGSSRVGPRRSRASGHLLAGSEATDTLEAVEVTAPETTKFTPVNGLVTEAPGEDGLNPELGLEGGDLVSSGTPTPVAVSTEPTDGFSVETQATTTSDAVRKEDIELVPLNIGEQASEAQLTDGSAAVIANSSTGVDTILRPAYDGLMTFQDIRMPSAPKTYSWEVRLGEGETLQLIDERHVGVFWEDGTQAMMISAGPAHDADGKEVLTTLSVSEGDVITLTVHHDVAGVIYPVVAGVGYEGGFQQILGEMPPPTEQGDPLIDTLEWTAEVGPPEAVASNDPDGQAQASSSSLKFIKKWAVRACPSAIIADVCGVWNLKFKGFFYYNFEEAWYPSNRDPRCEPFAAVNYSIDVNECNWVGPNHQPYGAGYHVTARTLWTVTVGFGVTAKSSDKAMVGRAFGSGNIYFHENGDICNPSRPDC